MPAPSDNSAGTPQPPEQEKAAARVATEIRGLMGARKLSPIDLAKALNVSRHTASRRINGETDLSINEVEAIAAWLDVPVTRLIAPAAGAGFSE